MKTRMTKRLRCDLKYLVRTKIIHDALNRVLGEAYNALAPLVRELVAEKYPVPDMALLACYNVAIQDRCIKLKLKNGTINAFDFTDSDDWPWIPDAYDCRHRIYDAGEDYLGGLVSARFAEWSDARDALTAANHALWTDYFALIDNARHLEEVCEVWPRACVLLMHKTSTAVSIVTPELIVRIKADQTARTTAEGFGT